MLRTSVFDPVAPTSEHVLYVWDNAAVNLAMLLGWLVLMRLALRFGGCIRLEWLTGIALSVTFALGVAWVLVLRAVPVNDPGILYYTAAELTRGDPSELWRHEVYLRTNPFQAGYLQYSELLQRVFGRHSYVPQSLLNAAFLTAAYGALMVAVLSGFLYHMLFEAKSQYLMIYLPMMAPLGAWGLTWRRKSVKAPPAS